MAKAETFTCSVITPERTVLDTEATFAAFPAHDGEMGVLRNRAPLVCKLGIGVLRVELGTDRHAVFIDGGFAQVVGNRLTILTQHARMANEITVASAEKAMVEARALPVREADGSSRRDDAIRRAQVQLRLAKNV